MSKEQAVKYYNTLYPAKQYKVVEFFTEQKKQRASKRLSRFLRRDMRILDYGCGPGGKLAELVTQGYRIYGHDLNTEYLQYACEQGLSLYDPDLQYDCIYLSHTIEHWLEPLADLQTIIESHLRDQGLLIVEVPLLDRLLLGARRNGIQGDIYFVHTWYFSVRALDKLLGQLRCRRIYTDRITLCVYYYTATSPVRRMPVTRFQDFLLRGMIDVCSAPLIGTTLRILSSVFKVYDPGR